MLRLCELFERTPYALGVDELVLGRIQRPLCPPVLHGYLARLENLLNRTANGHELTRIEFTRETQTALRRKGSADLKLACE